jgi:sterol desaturase/sphingolipid hydroxylase (fatty acid hydroxylase superfamily)
MLEKYTEIIVSAFSGYASYIWSEITFQVSPWYVNYFWMLVALSLVVWGLEALFPWRKNQPLIRKDFWLDTFYMFFNFYIFNLIIFVAFSEVTKTFVNDLIPGGVGSLVLYDTTQLPKFVQLLVFFVVLDFIQWFTHVLLHKYPLLWQFHKVHHSVEQMGFAAHLRYHWMENVIYSPMKYMVMMLIGNFSPEDAYLVYYLSIAIGHLNHANIALDYGPLKYILNNPKMHIWHHAKELPASHPYGMNFGISLSIWDYIFRKAYIPSSGRDIVLGFEDDKDFPQDFIHQNLYPFVKEKTAK